MVVEPTWHRPPCTHLQRPPRPSCPAGFLLLCCMDHTFRRYLSAHPTPLSTHQQALCPQLRNPPPLSLTPSSPFSTPSPSPFHPTPDPIFLGIPVGAGSHCCVPINTILTPCPAPVPHPFFSPSSPLLLDFPGRLPSPPLKHTCGCAHQQVLCPQLHHPTPLPLHPLFNPSSALSACLFLQPPSPPSPASPQPRTPVGAHTSRFSLLL